MSLKKRGGLNYGDAKKILETVYPELAQNIVPNLNKIKSNVLYQNSNNLENAKEALENTLNGLKTREIINSARQPLSTALESIPQRNLKSVSNVLLFRTRNQLLDKSDFNKLAPKTQSNFDLDSIPGDNYNFIVRSGRYPQNLEYRVGYYLIFDSIEEAAAFNVDTLKKQINGINFNTEMIDAKANDPVINIRALNESSIVENGIMKLKPGFPRKNCVLVKGFPNFIKKHTIFRMLYDYELDDSFDALTTIDLDNHANLGKWLIKFSNSIEAQRFVRNYHGLHLNDNPEMPRIYAEQLF
ncbi:hypothetical protein BN7_998 [Wickerhamomyces ciferrii]|uniref:Uncharacterized protein n=1 Tax=Wickerhamomyces ciferrii (strain ATCC 14091 / BCRC 22168 / CBS 111 / JCM 3599 / NBRC 0793 / NRRL Y-1031 F-60-10) TaxID=1206466 RepID=K0KGZ8_WICCF|nr:uncharacterized protein BN7_998 [Wickerhamomyces ciferrii]CCH41457.1 hypothetical protein BN7_998 [Wickerhamomyces ciferrii]